MKEVRLTKAELEAVLTNILDGFKSGDTLEGSVQFTIDMDESAAELGWMVGASYRIGNREGQGALRVIGELE